MNRDIQKRNGNSSLMKKLLL